MDMDQAADMTPEDASHSAQEPGKRERSKIDFPYSDLDGALDLSRMLLSKTGGAPCEDTQLACWMNQTATGGTFRTRVYAARMFGLIEMGQGRISLSHLGRNALDETHASGALVDAFLRVPLFSKLYELYKGYVLPPAAAIERQIESLGVSPKQKDRARQTFMKSAITAGFVDAQTGRFTKPAVASAPPAFDTQSDRNKGGDDDGGNGHHPFIEGLLKTLPKTGENWPVKDRAKWLKLAANAFDLIYAGDGEIEIKVKAAGEVPAA